ncbi:MAG: dTDP-4-dehydrorhamnose 3,5-epimerase, partial [Alphaproteobacteria bacterium]|nr:dTDP-4-dehydrorhamnose 3,5-epimerase [Alphaproteobacteria bacterium]
MIIRQHAFAGVHLIATQPRRDERGSFARLYDAEALTRAGLHRNWLQENEAVTTRKHVIRGLHFQRPPASETKLVRCALGAILDVFVDLRRGSPSFGRWSAVTLSQENGEILFLPRGFAHGYCTLTDTTLVSYKVDARYDPASEGGVNWADPDLAIGWPTDTPILSERDRTAPRLRNVAPLDVGPAEER